VTSRWDPRSWKWIRRPISFEIGLFVVCIMAGLIWLVHLASHGRMLSLVSATTEMASYVVSDPENASLPVHGMAVRSDESPGAKRPTCANGLIRPMLNSNIRYSRVGYGPLTITISQRTGRLPLASGSVTASLFAAGGSSYDLHGTVLLMPDERCDQDEIKGVQGSFNVNDTLLKTCGYFSGAVNPPLPIYGDLTVGSEFHPARNGEAQPYLLKGSIKVLAESLKPLGFSLFPASLYKDSDLDLPVGSRLIAQGPEDHSSMPNWWGVCYCEPQKAALQLEVATNATRLQLFRPDRHTADIIEVTATTRTFDDPNLVKIYKLFGIAVAAVALVKWWREHRAKEVADASPEP
jgi:hypothetical protein